MKEIKLLTIISLIGFGFFTNSALAADQVLTTSNSSFQVDKVTGRTYMVNEKKSKSRRQQEEEGKKILEAAIKEQEEKDALDRRIGRNQGLYVAYPGGIGTKRFDKEYSKKKLYQY